MIIKDIDCLVTCAGSYPKTKEKLKDAQIIKNGYIVADNDTIVDVGSGDGYKKYLNDREVVIDGKGKTVTPGLVDSHTHVVYAGSREFELSLKLKNVKYIDILKAGGGILSTVNSVRNTSLEKIQSETKKRLDLMLLHGTTTVESKSGYGLDFENEIKMLNVNKNLNDEHPISIVSTYLGAHAVPEEFKDNRDGYIDLIINKVIPYVKEQNLAEFIDCFCEKGVFSVEEARKILEAGKKAGFKAKIHADEVESISAAELAGEIKAVSAEHLVSASDEGIKSLANNKVVAVLLPTTSFYLMLNKFARARKMIEEGVIVALATDCNPGTSPTESLQSTMTFACFGLKMLPEEIINAMTINAAVAISKEKEIGSIEKGKKADISIFNAKNLDYLIYHFGVNAVDTVVKDGTAVVKNGQLVY
ncbi:imidazolonepropionase [Clostridium autoethanogenum]|uniref:Imidazolonepropionase n=2 Tax=Clostridium autoethanogenum TaxID=84023 RepID=A0A3M0SVE2_9CLOT|nr:imidazolonepropionase [Clostridium autoethanogenum]AGY74466.1 imidazolonepropionase [Clostridium autoethanogenum DSM 10061]ALU34654.1 Imidazolonepropionase [Clostridium autoethanogenum DSM 10061]OVY51374.1 Imidazolonepropionase [Clostridium autoethanogenum]RMD02463.1 imidazolonepropionase [Clostridium autoethanogenum]